MEPFSIAVVAGVLLDDIEDDNLHGDVSPLPARRFRGILSARK